MSATEEKSSLESASLDPTLDTILDQDSTKPAWTALQVRQKFLQFFETHQHHQIPGSEVIPFDDPSLLFTNAGMNQFKRIIRGHDTPAYQRVYNYQRCIRAGGKHNDLEDVGWDTYHHTFFEMLGNWSFGDYGKKEAIKLAWQLLTEEYGLDPSRLYVTYFEGDEELGLMPDHETQLLWEKYLPKHRILAGSTRDNFWEMEKYGPCGPSTEIHYDHIGDREVPELVNQDSPEVVELWNLVFIQFEKNEKGLHPLEKMSVDTGMGFERLVSILQHQKSNYDTDLFHPIFGVIQEVTGTEAYGGRYGAEELVDASYRILADHLRMVIISLDDGGKFGSQGHESVIRRIFRRAMVHLMEYLGGEPKMMTQLVARVEPSLRKLYPDLSIETDQLLKQVAEEEELYFKSMKTAVRQTQKRLRKLKEKGETQMSGEVSFHLYGSLGAPLEIQKILALKEGMTIDVPAFMEAFQKHRQESKKE